ncbi:MAG: LptF/LptG family permease [Bacteroidales bacterium]|nr:LptF/LptG family permease [Bacteroidales bacterium]
MKIFHRWVLLSFVKPWLLTFFLSIFVLLMQFLWKYIDDLVGKGIEGWMLFKLLFYASTTFVPMALPLSVLLASLMTFGSLGEHYELIAVKSSGISFRKLTQPYFIFITFLALFAFYFNNNILPQANLKMYALLFSVREQKPAFNLKPGVFYDEIEGYIIKVSKKGKDGKTLENIVIYDLTKPAGGLSFLIAKKGYMEITPDKRTLILTLFDGVSYTERRDVAHANVRFPFERFVFKEEVIRFDLSGFASMQTNEDLFKSHFQMMNVIQLLRQIDTLKNQFYQRLNIYCEQVFSGLHFYSNMAFKQQSTIQHKTYNISSWDEIDKMFTEEEKKNIRRDAVGIARMHLMLADNYKREKQNNRELIMRHYIEFHRKFTLAIACLIMFFIGAPLGAIIRKGGFGLPLVVSIIVFIFYYMISIIFEKFVREMTLPPFWGMWASTFLTFPIGIWLMYNVIREKPILELDAWTKAINRLLIKLKILKEKSISL